MRAQIHVIFETNMHEFGSYMYAEKNLPHIDPIFNLALFNKRKEELMLCVQAAVTLLKYIPIFHNGYIDLNLLLCEAKAMSP